MEYKIFRVSLPTATSSGERGARTSMGVASWEVFVGWDQLDLLPASDQKHSLWTT